MISLKRHNSSLKVERKGFTYQTVVEANLNVSTEAMIARVKGELEALLDVYDWAIEEATFDIQGNLFHPGMTVYVDGTVKDATKAEK